MVVKYTDRMCRRFRLEHLTLVNDYNGLFWNVVSASMVETRLGLNPNRSGTSSVELSPMGDYRRGETPKPNRLVCFRQSF